MVQAPARLPAEWEPQAAVLVAWPHADTDWAPRLSEVEQTYVALATAVTRFQHLIICVADAALEKHVQRLLECTVDLLRVTFVQLPYDDTWLRDSGPICLRIGDRFRLLDFHFTGWGGKFASDRDDDLVRALTAAGIFVDTEHRRIDWALEGGAVDSDGKGSLLTTWRCLHQRHPEQNRRQIETTLCETLAAERVLWLDHGCLQGDDTDAHIDTLARFAPANAIVFQQCDDVSDPHYAELQRMHKQLRSLRTDSDQAYRLHALPWAAPIIDEGRRLATSYANYLLLNGAVLVPAYGDPSDDVAAAVLGAAHPGRTVVSVPCRPLIWQNGSLHCITMQLPAGLVAQT